VQGVTEDGLPRAVAVAWGVAEFPQRGPKRELSHERIVEAAIELADTEGVEAVTMQRVAATFGFTTMALYRYIASKDELHRLMLDAALNSADLTTIADDQWRDGVLAWAGLLAHCYRRHPWVLQLGFDSDLLLMPNNMAFVDAGLRALRTLAVPLEERLGVIVGCTVLVRGFAAVEHELAAGSTHTPATVAAIREVATPARFPDLAPLVASGAYLDENVAPASGDALAPDLAFALSAFLDGVAARADGGGAEPPADAVPASPREAYEVAERTWRDAVARRKLTEQRVKELHRSEAEAQRARDASKELMKAAERLERRRGTDS